MYGCCFHVKLNLTCFLISDRINHQVTSELHQFLYFYTLIGKQTSVLLYFNVTFSTLNKCIIVVDQPFRKLQMITGAVEIFDMDFFFFLQQCRKAGWKRKLVSQWSIESMRTRSGNSLFTSCFVCLLRLPVSITLTFTLGLMLKLIFFFLSSS